MQARSWNAWLYTSPWTTSPHIMGGYFEVITDHHALTSLLTSSKLNERLMRWALALQVYDFSISHCSGATYQNANGQSRQDWDLPGTDATVIAKGGGDIGDRLPNTHTLQPTACSAKPEGSQMQTT